MDQVLVNLSIQRDIINHDLLKAFKKGEQPRLSDEVFDAVLDQIDMAAKYALALENLKD